MPVRYVVRQKKNPLDPSAPQKYYLIEKSVGTVDRDYLVNLMVMNTSLTQMEALTALNYLFKTIPMFLELGQTIQLGGLGYFRLSIKSEGSDTAEEATPDKVKSIHLRFTPGVKTKAEINAFKLRKIEE